MRVVTFILRGSDNSDICNMITLKQYVKKPVLLVVRFSDETETYLGFCCPGFTL